MKTFTALALLACAAMVAADVSHLAKSYLPPTKHSHDSYAPSQSSGRSITTTVIEQQELKELPEQIEFLPAEMQMVYQNEFIMPQTPRMPQTQYLPPQQRQRQPTGVSPPAMNYLPPSEHRESAHAQPSRQYLSPLAQIPEMQETQDMQEMRKMQQEQEMPSHQHQHHDHNQPQKSLVDQYLPPAHRHDVAPTYQQYQTQMPEQPETEPQLMQKVPMGAEPEPAHFLAKDGYHYKSGAARRLFRSRH